MPTGYFSLVLHAHLPFVRHPEYPEFLEEDWLYEAITEVYLPLIKILDGLHGAGAAPRLTINVSPPLCEMLSDRLLQERYTAHLENLLDLARKEERRTRSEDTDFNAVAGMYAESLEQALDLWNNRLGRNLVAALRELQDKGVLEIITCCATHGFLPLVSTPEARRAQIAVAVANYRKHFGRNPLGIWLAECAYERGIEDILKEFGIRYFIGDSHAILYGDPRPRFGVHAPVLLPNGVALFARDVETSQQVWSAEVGYPGDPFYREFYRDVGWDLPIEYLSPHLHKDGKRRHLGLKYFRITGRDVPQDRKGPYLPSVARERAASHAADFIEKRIAQALALREDFGGHTPFVTSPYDAELFGHWWFEGPMFLDFLFRKLHWDQDSIQTATPGDFLDASIPIQIQEPSASSWGESGYFKVWLNEGTQWMYPYQHDAERKMTQLADSFPNPTEPQRRILDQMARELLLAQSSDWAFQIYQGTTVEYSSKRFRSHIQRFNLLAEMVESGRFDDRLLTEIELRDNLFPELSYEVYSSLDR